MGGTSQLVIPSFPRVLNHFCLLLQKLKIPYALVGGLAVGALARERATMDIDLTVLGNQKKAERLIRRLKSSPSYKIQRIDFASTPKIPDLVRVEREGISVDLIFANIAYQRLLIKRAKLMKLGRSKIPVISPEDLFILKLIAYRPQDRADIHSLLEQDHSMDWSYIKRWSKRWEIITRLKDFLPHR